MEYETKRKETWKQIRDSMFPDGCIICGSHVKLQLHEKNGKKHNCQPAYYLAHLDEVPKDFVPLCFNHHKMVHHLINFYKLSVEKRNQIMELIVSNSQTYISMVSQV
jgi:hypothetical protein